MSEIRDEGYDQKRRRDPGIGADGAHVNSAWYKLMTEGTPEQIREVRRKMAEYEGDRRALETWALAGFHSRSHSEDEHKSEEEWDEEHVKLTPDVDAYLQRRGYDPKGEDE